MNAKRGFVPEDQVNFSMDSIETMRTASRHIIYLINEGYGIKQASTFVGNHFMLSERQRLAIVRSLADDPALKLRKEKKLPAGQLEDQTIWIDGFNTMITLEVMLSGSPLFDCMDGSIRDLAALRGTYRLIPETEKAVRLLLSVLNDHKAAKAVILLDQPVSNSGRLKSLIAEVGEEYSLPLDIQVLRDVDRTLYGKPCVVTSDSVILDQCQSWVNLVRECMNRFDREYPLLKVW